MAFKKRRIAMRATLSRWSLVVAIATCMSLVSVTGCKSGMGIPGADWLSWGKKPSPTSISSSSQRKPSASALPTPSATTAATGPLASYPNSNYSQSSLQAQVNKGGYRTGPYGTGASSQAGVDRYSGTGTPLGGSSYTGNPPAGAPYQSPYQASGSTYPTSGSGSPIASQNGYATSDSRNSLYNAAQSTGNPPSTSYQNASQTRRGGDPYSSQVEPAGYGSTPGSYSQPFAGNTSSPSGQPGYPNTYSNPLPSAGSQQPGAGASSFSGGSPTTDAARGTIYRPGSTARDSSSLPARNGSSLPARNGSSLPARNGSSLPARTADSSTLGGSATQGSATRPTAYPMPGATPSYGGDFSYPSTGR